ncbi:toxin-antitoxin system HicB family antitoxin [Amycolatopsis alkalitolerans]|uniref:Toxin-antitoxin system HicB family antitoxin n=1 Tax=Amycolatopsis alkalitolerans TaxID=2547244 RepID=A0A5C4LXH0_9PSEU|nr:toxin-antitoxin system HicB family antitoxin [Amycolatopsis alkalitolerans]TNC23220.1 toxin-antitoxin system HicB family antitoxin [Amycolatopsis alkalitolerans]
MSQVTWRAGEELVRRVQLAAKQQGKSMNEYLTQVLDAATNPDLAGDEAARVRERLQRAGLLWESKAPRARPDPAEVAAARAAAGRGTPVSSLVGDERE